MTWAPLGSGAGIDTGALAEPGAWVGPCRALVAVEPDLFGPAVPAATIEAVVAAMRAAPRQAFVLATRRAKRLLALANEGLAFPPNLWLGVGVSVDEDVWRVEDLLRCNTVRAWVAADPLRGPLPSLPIGMLAWVTCRLGAGAGDAGLPWARDLRDRCRGAGVPFAYGGIPGGGSAPARLDGAAHQELPADLAAAPGGAAAARGRVRGR